MNNFCSLLVYYLCCWNIIIQPPNELMQAAKIGNLFLINKLLKNPTIDIQEKNEALAAACQYGFEKIALRLLSEGADIHYDNDLPLLWAAINGHTAIVKQLIEHGADIHANHENVLLASCINGRTEVLELLREYDANLMRYQNFILPFAAHNGYSTIIEWLIVDGVDLHQHNDDAFCKAALAQKYETARILLKHGKKQQSLTSFSDDLKNFRAQFFAEPLLHAAYENDVEQVAFLTQKAPSTTISNYLKRIPKRKACSPLTGTALHWAVAGHAYDVMHFLLTHNVRINTKDKEGKTALMYAAEIGNIPAALLLLKQGKQPLALNATDKKGMSALDHAVRFGHFDMVKLLIEHGAMVTPQSLHCAVKYNYMGIFLLLFKNDKIMQRLFHRSLKQF